MKHIPNIITAARILCVPVLVLVLMREDFRSAFYLAVFMGASDALDGFLAKRYRWQSRLGERLDPIADKLMLVGAYLMFGLLDLLPLWLVALIIGRDALIVGGYLCYRWLNVDFEVRPSVASKVNTFFQILLVFAVLIAQIEVELAELVPLLGGIVAATTLLSGASYALTARNLLARPSGARAV